MMDIQDGSLYRYLVIGEKDRYSFLDAFLNNDKLLDISNMIKNDIIVLYGEDILAKKKENVWVITTPYLTPLTCLYFPQDGLGEKLIEENTSEFFLLLESDPFRRQNNISFLEKISKKLLHIHIVIGLLDLPRHQAYTDTLPVGEDLRLAQQKYNANGYDTVVLKSREDIQNIFCCNETTYDIWLRDIRDNVARLNEKIENRDIVYDFQYLWEDLPVDSIRFPEIQAQKLCSFNYLKLHKHNNRILWNNYVEGGYQILFPASTKGGVFDFLLLYRYSLVEVNTAFWDIEEDEKALLKMLEKRYLDLISKSKYNNVTTPIFNDESEYEKYLSEKSSILFGIRAEFSKSFSEFIKSEIVNCIEVMLRKRYSQLKEFLNEC